MSSSQTAGFANRRDTPRFTLLIRAARLVLDGRDHLCVIRDISATGMKIRLFHPLPPHQALEIGLGNGASIPAEVAWSEGDHLGLRLLSPISVDALLLEDRDSEGRAPLHLAVTIDALVHAGREAMPARVTGIGQQALSIEVPQTLLIGEQIRIQTALLQPLVATVRARGARSERGLAYALDLAAPFRLDELSRTVMAIHLTANANLAPARFASFADRRAS